MTVANNINEKIDEKRRTKPLILREFVTYYHADSTIIETAWVDNKLVFENETLKDVALKMERRYNVKIVFGDEEVTKLRVYGRFENPTVVQVLDALRKAFDINYKIKDNETFIVSSP
jgi:ferric-dicitrate binding protein FerR (iron transport regulator)